MPKSSVIALAAALLFQGASAQAQSALSRRPDERRPSQQATTQLFGRDLVLGGQYELTHQTRENFDLDSAVRRNRSRLDQELKLEALYRARPDVSVFVQAVGLAENDTHRSSGARTSERSLERGQTWVYFSDLASGALGLQAGRVALVDPRTWWWDEDLDAVRLLAGRGDWLLETGLARELGRKSSEEPRIDPEQDGVVRWFGRAAWQWTSGHTVETYWLRARDHSSQPSAGTVLPEDAADASDPRLRWIGLRAAGDQRLGGSHRLGYWVDTGWVRGHETVTDFDDAPSGQVRSNGSSTQAVRGQGFDTGLMWTLPGAWRPTLTAAYARGDHGYRQTGLQENKARFRGVNRFRYYGELLRPDLSNLEIRTLAFGFRFLPRSSLEIVLHDYRQVDASRSLASDRLDADPLGTERSLGRELDLVLGIREWERVELAARLARFRAGAAFGPRQGEHATLLELAMTLVF